MKDGAEHDEKAVTKEGEEQLTNSALFQARLRGDTAVERAREKKDEGSGQFFWGVPQSPKGSTKTENRHCPSKQIEHFHTFTKKDWPRGGPQRKISSRHEKTSECVKLLNGEKKGAEGRRTGSLPCGSSKQKKKPRSLRLKKLDDHRLEKQKKSSH